MFLDRTKNSAWWLWLENDEVKIIARHYHWNGPKIQHVYFERLTFQTRFDFWSFSNYNSQMLHKNQEMADEYDVEINAEVIRTHHVN